MSIQEQINQSVQALYVAFYDRAADAEGLAYWYNVAMNDGDDYIYQIADGFANHPAFEDIYGGMDDEAFVKAIYLNVTNNDNIDSGALTYWMDQVAEFGRAHMVADFTQAVLSYDGTDADGQYRTAYLQAKVDTGLAFAGTLGEDSNPTNPDNLENDPAYIAAQDIMSKFSTASDIAAVEAVKTEAMDYIQTHQTLDMWENQAPTMNPADAVVLNEDGSASGSVSASDVDNDYAGQILTFSMGTAPANGTATVNADGSFNYVPYEDFNGTDSFEVIVADGEGGSDTAIVNITVNPVNDAPVAPNASVITDEDTAIAVTVEAIDVDGDALTYSIAAQASHGNVFINPDGSFTYTPDENFHGIDTFTYVANDGTVDSNEATVTVDVNAVNDAPVTSDLSVVTDEDTAGAGQVIATDVDGDALTYSISNAPVNGDVLLDSATGEFSYTPYQDYNGEDSFEVMVDDGNGGTAVSKVNLTVTPVNDAPVAENASVITDEDNAINIVATATDVENDSLTYSVVAEAEHGTVVVNPNGTFTYTPVENYNGEDSFIFVANDGTVDSNEATVSINVNAVAPNFTLTSLEDSVLEGSNMLFTLTASEPVDVDTQVTFTLQPGRVDAPDADTNFTNDNDFAEPNKTVTVTIPAGETEAWFTVEALVDDITELNEIYTVKAEVVSGDGAGSDTLFATVDLINVQSGCTFNLTSSPDVQTAVVFNSTPAYTPGGNDLVNTLQDEDILTGNLDGLGGDCATDTELNVTLGSSNDGSEVMVAPTLIDVHNVNVMISDDAAGINFQKTQDVRAINIDAITTLDAKVDMINIQESTTTLSVANSTTNGDVLFNYQEGELEGRNDSVTLNLKGVRQDSLSLDQGDASASDNTEDEDYGIEHLTVNVEDRSTNIDLFMVEANAMEDRYHGTEQDVTFNVHKDLEINQLIAKGAEDITINTDAGTLTEVTLDENPNNDGFDNKGLDLAQAQTAEAKAVQTEEMDHMTITGGGKVVLNGVTGNADNDTDYYDENVIIDASAMTETSTLAIRVDDNVAGDRGSVLKSGKGTDEVITTTTTRMTIDTSDGADMVRIGTNAPADEKLADSDATVMTGAGADRVEVQGDINAAMDTSASATSATVDGVNDGDEVYAHNLNASLSTGAGADHIEVIKVTADASISTGTEDDYVKTGYMPGELTNGSDSYVGNGDVDGDIDLGTGSDRLYIYGGLDANVTAGSDEETGNANGQDYVYISGTMSSTATITTQAGDDTVRVNGSIKFNENDFNAAGHDTAINTGVGSDEIYVRGDADRAIIAGVDGETSSDNDIVTVSGNLGGYADIDTNAGVDIVSVGVLGVDDADDMSRDGISQTNDTTGVTTETDVGGTVNAKGTGKVEGDADIDTTNAADIRTGAGDDTVTAHYLESAGQYNDNAINFNGNTDDTVTIVGASIVTGSGIDTVNLTQTNTDVALMAEQTLVDTGSEGDFVNARVYAGVVMEADNAKADRLLEREGVTRNNLDSLGAKIALGSGDDELNFYDDIDSEESESVGIVDKGAVIDGGEGNNDILTIKTVDTLDVVNHKTYHDIFTDLDEDGSLSSPIVGLNANNKLGVTAGQGGHIEGIETINLTIADSIDANEVANENVDIDRDGDIEGSEVRYVANDDTSSDALGNMTLDVEQVDEALTTINLTSEEVRHEIADQNAVPGYWSTPSEASGETPVWTDAVDGVENGYIKGEVTEFRVENFRDDANIELNLFANETAVSDTLTITHDGYVAGNGTDIADDCETDVKVTVNMDAVRTIRQNGDDIVPASVTDEELAGKIAENRIFTLNMEAAVVDNDDFTAEDANYDVNLDSLTTYIDMEGANDHSSDEIDSRYARDIVLNVNTKASNVVDMTETYGNVEDRVYVVKGTDSSAPVDKYLDTVEATSVANALAMVEFDHNSKYVDLTNPLNATEVVTSLTVNGTTAGEQFVVRNVSADNISIDAGTAADAVADAFVSVREENAYNITTGGGDDVLDMRNDTLVYEDGIQDNSGSIINDDDKLDGGAGTDTLLIAGGQDIVAGLFENNISNIEKLEVNFDEYTAATSNLAIDSTHLDEVLVTNINHDVEGIRDEDDDADELNTINFNIYASNPDDALIINADVDNSGERENVCNPNEDSTKHSADLELNINAADTDLDIRVNTAEGTRVNLDNVDQANEVVVTATVSSIDHTIVDATNGGDDEGELMITSDTAALDKLVLKDEKGTDGNDNGFYSNDYVDIEVDNSWADAALEIDASDIGNAKSDYFVTESSHTSSLTSNPGTDDNDQNWLDADAETDAELLIKASNDSDSVIGGQQSDEIYGDAGADTIRGGEGYDVVDGGSGEDYIFGGLNGDTLTGGAYNYVDGVKEDAADSMAGSSTALASEKDIFALGVKEAFNGNGTAQDAVNESNSGLDGRNADTITDFQTGVDKLQINIGEVFNSDEANFVSLATFATVVNPADGDDSLAGTDLKPVMGDMFYSSETGHEKFVMDVDGNGDITTNDITVMSANAINISDLDIQLETGAGDDIIRIGQSIDRIDAGADDDALVIVGQITDADKANYLADLQADGVMNVIEDVNLGDVVDVNELITERTETEANVGDKLVGGDGNDTLHVYGTADLTVMSIDADIENIDLHSNVTMTNAQFDNFATVIFDGTTTHTLTIVDYDGAFGGGAVITNDSVITFNGVEYDTSDSADLTAFKVALGTDEVYSSVDELYAAYPFEIQEVNDNDGDASHELNDINIATDDVTVSGTSHPGAYVTVTAENGETAEGQADNDGNWTVIFDGAQMAGIEDDNFTFDAEAQGVEGSTTDDVRHADQVEVAIDTIAPTIDTIQIDDGGDEWVNDAEDNTLTVSGTTTGVEDGQTLTVELEDENGHTVSVDATVNANAWTTAAADIGGFTSGDVITATANVSDSAGNPADKQMDTSSLDNVNPTLEISFTNTGATDEAPAPAETQVSTISIDTASDADSGVATTTYAIAGVSKTAQEITDLADGDYTGVNNIDVTLTDVAGNTTTKSVDFIKDTISPVVDAPTLDTDSTDGQPGHDSDNISNEGNATANVTDTNAIPVDSTLYTVMFGGAEVLTDATKTDFDTFMDDRETNHNDGEYIVTAKSTDQAGNEGSSDTLTFILDTQVEAPTTPDLDNGTDSGDDDTDNITSDNTPTFEGVAGSVEGGAKVDVYSDLDGHLGYTIAENDGSWLFTVDVADGDQHLVDTLQDGTHQITVKQTDIAGNESAVSSALEIKVDNTAPVAPSFDWHEDTTDEYTAGADSDDISYDNTIDVVLNETDSAAYWEYSTNAGSNWTEVKDGSTSFELVDNKSYAIEDIQVREVDATGNVGDIAKNSTVFETDDTADSDDNLSVVIHDDDDTLGNNGYINENEAGSLKYTISGVDTDVNDSSDTIMVITDKDGNVVELTGSDVTNGDHTVDISGLEDGEITVTFTVEDIAGNKKVVDGTFDEGDTSSIKDTVGPTLEKVVFSGQTDKTNDITDTDNTHTILGSSGDSRWDGAALNDDIQFSFSEDVLVPTDAIQIMDGGTEKATNSSALQGTIVSINPDPNLDDGSSYDYTVDGTDADGVTDLAGNLLQGGDVTEDFYV